MSSDCAARVRGHCAKSVWANSIKCSEKPVLIEKDCKIRYGQQAHCSSETMRVDGVTAWLVALLGTAQGGDDPGDELPALGGGQDPALQVSPDSVWT